MSGIYNSFEIKINDSTKTGKVHDVVINTAEKEMVESGDVNQDDFIFPLSEGEQYIDKQEIYDEEDDPDIAAENWLEEVYACHNMSVYEHVYIVEVETEN